MPDLFTFELVSPEKLLFSGEVEQVLVPGAEGDMTVMAKHAPLITTLRPGLLELDFPGGKRQRFFARGGFAEVIPAGLTVLAETRCSTPSSVFASAMARDRLRTRLYPQAERRERRDHGRIDGTFERHDQCRQITHGHPAPRIELRLMVGSWLQVDIALGPFEPRRIPHLLLASIFALPGDSHQFGRQVIDKPVLGLGKKGGIAHPGLFP